VDGDVETRFGIERVRHGRGEPIANAPLPLVAAAAVAVAWGGSAACSSSIARSDRASNSLQSLFVRLASSSARATPWFEVAS